ncbi:MAG: four helix bundle protein [Chloroflexi bacterium]|nr:four helix bundle protein [Chloroflexota bacterium]
MPKITRFEDLQAWQKARQLTQVIDRLALNAKFARDDYLRNQIRRAAGSVMHNTAEGFDSGSGPEFIRFLKMARRSASEVQSELYQALDRKHITEEERQRAYDLASEAKRLINGLIAYLRKRKS